MTTTTLRAKAAPLAAALLLSACFHATVETGRPPSTQTVEREWAMSFLWGLVPPPTVETAAQCPAGVSKVETQRTFVNEVVRVITFGIVSPMSIRVTCAAGTASIPAGARTIHVGAAPAAERTRQAVGEAADAAVRTGEAVYLTF